MPRAWRAHRTITPESVEQKQLARELDKLFPGLWYHCPNGGDRELKVALAMMHEGVKKGIPDVLIYAPFECREGSFVGCAIELKKERGGTVSPEQRLWLVTLKLQGWYTQVCEGVDVALGLLTQLYTFPYSPPTREITVCYGCLATMSPLEIRMGNKRTCRKRPGRCQSKVHTISSTADMARIIEGNKPKAKPDTKPKRKGRRTGARERVHQTGQDVKNNEQPARRVIALPSRKGKKK